MDVSKPTLHSLDCGLRVACCPLPHLHSVGIGLYTRVGPRYEHAENTGITHFLEHVIFRGNSRYENSLAMNRAFEAWGGSFNGYTTREYTYFFGKLYPSFIEEGVRFMSDFIRQPRFDEIDVEREIILEERMEDVDADGQDLDVDDVLRQAMWGNHPLGLKIIGTPLSLRRIHESQLRAHFDRYFGLENLVLCLTGRFETESILPVIEEAFRELPRGEKREPTPAPIESSIREHATFVYNDSSQVSLQLCFQTPAPHEDGFLHLLLLDRILDDGMSSRLWQRLVEEQGLCYELWSSTETYFDVSMFDVGASVAPEKVLPLVEGIYQQLALIREHGPTPEELDLARRRWRFSQEYVLDRVEAMNERLGASHLYHRFRTMDEVAARIDAITCAEITKFARKFLTKDRHVLAAVGPLSKSTKRRLRDMIKALP